MQLCFGCMQEFEDEYELCPHCGFVIGTQPQIKNHLPYGTLLRDRYIVGKSLGHGGFGITYIAWDDTEGRTVAIKEFFPNSVSSRNAGETQVACYIEKSSDFYTNGIKKMLDEGERLSRFRNNENIVDVFDYFEENNTAYIVMEYLEGQDLKKYLEQVGGKLEPQAAIKIMLPILNALADMHSDNLIHRDVSPDNIFICDDGRIKLLDFGSARLAVQDESRSLSVLIKAGYAPQEQYMSRSKQGPWTDVYAACATLYRIVTGEIPTSSTERDTVPLKTFSQLGIYGHDELEAVVFRGLEPDIEKRIRYAQVLERELNAVYKAYNGDYSELNKWQQKKQKETKKIKIRKIALIAAGVAAGVAVIAAIIGFIAGHKEQDNPVAESVAQTTVYESPDMLDDVQTIIYDSEESEEKSVVSIISSGEKKRSELINLILADVREFYAADINADGKCEFVTKTQNLNFYSNIDGGDLRCQSYECSDDSEVYFDKKNGKIAVSDSGEQIVYTLSDDGFSAKKQEEAIDYDKSGFISSSDTVLIAQPADNINWYYIADENLLYISGSGNFREYNNPIESFDEDFDFESFHMLKQLVIADDVKGIPRELCNDMRWLSDVYIGSSVEVISTDSFAQCGSLETIVLPESLKTIESMAFFKSAVKAVYIPQNVSQMSSDSFMGCEMLEKITVDEDNAYFVSDSHGVLYTKDYKELLTYPIGNESNDYYIDSSCERIADCAFARNMNLSSINFNNRLKYIGKNAFSLNEYLSKIELPDSLETIDDYAFNNCTSLLYASLGKNTKTIGNGAFSYCTELKSIEIPSGLETIGYEAFSECYNLELVKIPSSVSYVGSEAFGEWSKTQTIIIDNSRRKIANKWDSDWSVNCNAQIQYQKLI